MDDRTDDSVTLAAEAVGVPAIVAGRYRIRRRLGRGAMKEVYLAYDERLDREVALAIVVGAGASDVARARVVREAQVTGRLGDHPNVITVYDTGEHDGLPYLVLRAMDGGSLADEIARGRPGIEAATRVGAEIAAGLAHAHAHGVVHRDVKPDNVWLSADGSAALGDFGIAEQAGLERLTADGVVVGTVRYLSPEQIRGDGACGASDLYALGITLYELVTGEPPFTGSDPAQTLAHHLTARPRPPSELEPSVPPELERLILGLLAKEPEQRPTPALAVQRELTGMAPGPTREAAARRPLDGAGALPVPLTTLFARDGDVEALTALIAGGGARMVTLIGPGGVGKTRLCIEAARRLAPEFADGARFVSLASVADPRDLASAVHRALGAPARESEPPALALQRFLGDRELLLVLDNFEHILAGAPLVAELLATCPRLSMLMTSREPTRLAGERLYPVRPLAVPDAAEQQRIEAYGAVALFVDRVRAREPGFVLDEAGAPHAREICRRLDGLPLAIELAAARVGLLSIAELAARLDTTLSVLGGGSRDGPARHRTLRATIDWSFGLLTDAECEAFTQFAVFSGGATVPVAERVTRASLDTLDSLVAKQLLLRRGDRLLMLETVREYALEQLAADPQAHVVHDRHTTWCIEFAREATPHLVRTDRGAWLARLDAELPNLLAALARALEHERPEPALQLAAELGEYWWRTYQWQTGRTWLNAVIAQSDDAPAHARAHAFLTRARLISIRDGRRFEADLRTALELFRGCHDDAGIAACLGHLADLEAWHARFETSAALCNEAMRFAQRADDPEAIALVQMQQAFAADGYDETAQRARPALAALRLADNLVELGNLCVWTGYIAIVECRYDDALAWLVEGLEAARVLGHSEARFHLRSNAGLAWLFLGDLDEAAVAFSDALAVCHPASCEDLVDETLLGAAAVAAARGQLARAATLDGAATRHATVSQAFGEVTIRERLRGLLEAPRVAYGAERWNRAAAEGASLTVHEAIDLALEDERVITA